MPMEKRRYEDIRDLVLPGDVVAFGGNNPLSLLLKALTGSNVSHVSTIFAAADGATEPLLIEATVRILEPDPTVTVAKSPFKNRMDYDGDIWWLPVAPAFRARLDVGRFRAYLDRADGKPFNVAGGFFVTVRDAFQRLPFPDRGPQAYFCSELVAGAFEAGGAFEVEESDASPVDVCSWRMYTGVYSYLEHEPHQPKEIGGYNSRPPGSTN